VGEKEELSTMGGNVNSYNHYGKQYEDFYHAIQQYHSWACTWRKVSYNSKYNKATCTLMFVVTLFTIADKPATDEYIKKTSYIHRMDYTE
jgi:hypothetical protein